MPKLKGTRTTSRYILGNCNPGPALVVILSYSTVTKTLLTAIMQRTECGTRSGAGERTGTHGTAKQDLAPLSEYDLGQ